MIAHGLIRIGQPALHAIATAAAAPSTAPTSPPINARIKASIWSDPDFAALPAPVQRVYLVITSQSELTLCGVVQPSPKRWARYAPDTTVEEAMRMMTEGRFRHLPVIDGGRVAGLISIGDVVKTRIMQQTHEVDSLRAYVAGAA